MPSQAENANYPNSQLPPATSQPAGNEPAVWANVEPVQQAQALFTNPTLTPRQTSEQFQQIKQRSQAPGAM